MTVSLGTGGDIRVSGAVPAADAEVLLRLLLENREAAIDWRDCDACHTAVLQVIVAARRTLIGPPKGAALRLIAISV